MRVLLLLRGSAGCGKTTWIKNNGLNQYALSADDIRMLCQSPSLQNDGSVGIDICNEKLVWKTLFSILEERMKRGEFTVIDATNSKTSEMNRYKEMCSTYRYRIYCVDFTDIPMEEVKRRNANRYPTYKRVPDETIERMYARFQTQKIPSGIKVLKPDEIDSIWMRMIDLSSYKAVHHIGDIHGCNTVLQKYLNDYGGIKENEFYIFTGDYIDRGVENVEVVKFLISIMNKSNVLLLEGNHERWLQLYGSGCIGKSKEFELVTKPQLDGSDINKKDIRNLYRRLGQCAFYRYDDKVFLVTHAGLSTIPDNLTFVAAEQMIKGVGDYNDFETIAESFYDTTSDNCYQIHGHRNTKMLPVQVNDRVFNLEGQVEFGGNLRCVQIDKDGIHIVETKNDVFKSPETKKENAVVDSSVADIIISMRNNKYIKEKKFGNISSFNFTQKAFFDRVWNEQTVKARGLYLDTYKGKVVCRGYEKFYNINEMPETKFDMLQYKLKFPVTAYVKENGFLGLVSYNEYDDDLLITTKSDMEGDFAQWFKEMLYEKVGTENLLDMKQFIKKHDVTFVFECVDMKNDPHIIEYEESAVFLLDIVYNDIEFKKYKYSDMCNVASRFSLRVKELAYEIANWQEFFDWYYDVLAPDYDFKGRKIEGFVIEDSRGFMTKLKLTYYNFWKFMRSIAHEAIRKGYVTRTSALTSPTANYFYAWVKQLHNVEDLDSVPRDICTLRKLFYKETGLSD